MLKISPTGQNALNVQSTNSIYNECTMSAKHLFGITLLLLGTLAILFVLTNFNLPTVSANSGAVNSAALHQSTATPQPEDNSKVGSTDGILMMGVVIVLVITLPLALRKKT